ncbi:hypothetical protein JCM11251_005975 [Rhodosporidiobolus azoricus]
MTAPAPPTLTPQLALDLRLRLLESLLLPTLHTATSPRQPKEPALPLARRIARVQEQLEAALGTGAGGGAGTAAGGASEAVRRFVQNYDLNAPLLSVAPVPFSSSGSLLGEDISPQAKVHLVLEAEHEIRSLERDLREIQVLDERSVVGAGKLGEHETLKPRLTALRQSAAPIASSYASLETRTTALLQQYNDYISTLSELFVSWNDVLSEAEDVLTKVERERNKGYDIE